MLGKAVEVGDLAVVPVSVLIYGEEEFLGIEGEVPEVVVDEIMGVRPVTNDEELHEAQQRVGITVAGILLVIDDLLHSPAGADFEGLELDLGAGNAVDQQDHVEALKAVAGVDAQLADDLEVVFAPVLDVDQSEVQGGAIVSLEVVDLPEGLRSLINIRCGNLVEQAGELAVGELDRIEPLELVAEVGLHGLQILNVGTVGVFEAQQLCNKGVFDVLLLHHRCFFIGILSVSYFWGHGDGRRCVKRWFNETLFTRKVCLIPSPDWASKKDVSRKR